MLYKLREDQGYPGRTKLKSHAEKSDKWALGENLP